MGKWGKGGGGRILCGTGRVESDRGPSVEPEKHETCIFIGINTCTKTSK